LGHLIWIIEPECPDTNVFDHHMLLMSYSLSLTFYVFRGGLTVKTHGLQYRKHARWLLTRSRKIRQKTWLLVQS
jgi:hypothetical protein